VYIGGRYYDIEAKRCDPSLSRNGDAMAVIRKGMNAAVGDIKSIPYNRDSTRVGLVFAAPCIVDHRWNEWPVRLQALLDDLRQYQAKYRCGLAWTFPPWGAGMKYEESSRTYIFPGAVLLMRSAGA